jgi:hypothetical protein
VDAHVRGRLPLDASDGEGFTDKFRRIVGARYRLLPCVYAQVRLCSEAPPDTRSAVLRVRGASGQLHGGGRVDARGDADQERPSTPRILCRLPEGVQLGSPYDSSAPV